jgi:hypothetical protein
MTGGSMSLADGSALEKENEFIPYGCDPTAYRLAQERMYGLNKRRDILKRLISEVDKELKETIKEARELLSEYPTLSLQTRKT